MLLTETYDTFDLTCIENLYNEAFPENERKPFSLILQKCHTGHMEILKVEDDSHKFVGLVIMVLYDDLALLDYFAISPTVRNSGYGSHVLECLNERYAGKRLIIEIEDPEIPSDNTPERIRRKAFYLKNGMTIMSFKVNYFGTEMLILTNGATVTYDEYDALYHKTFDAKIYESVKRIQ